MIATSEISIVFLRLLLLLFFFSSFILLCDSTTTRLPVCLLVIYFGGRDASSYDRATEKFGIIRASFAFGSVDVPSTG